MKYRCISDCYIEDVKIMSEGDIIVTNNNDLFNISTGIDYRNIENINSIIKRHLINITDDNIPEKTSNVKQFEEIINQMLDTYKKKNADYGDSFTKSLDKFGIIASVVRMEDKMNRIENLTNSTSVKVKDESIQDSLMDLANYCVMTVMWLNGRV